MVDPELRSDEKILLRTPGVYVKSIPFEGILTNRRIILVDRAKNLLPPTEIPLVAIKEFESGENAIRDQIIMLSVVTKTGELRQMILTFSRQTGGNRIKERDDWMRLLRENVSFIPDQVIRTAVAAPEPVYKRTEPAAGQRYEIVRSPVRTTAPSDEGRASGAAPDGRTPDRRAVTPQPAAAAPPSLPVRQPEQHPSGTTVFCSKCGNKVPAESVFCNRCGSQISPVSPVPAPRQPTPASVQTPATPPAVKMPAARPIDEEIRSIEPLIERSTVRVPPDPLRTVKGEPPMKQSVPREEEKKTVSVSPAVMTPGENMLSGDSGTDIPAAKSPESAVSAPVPSPGDTGDIPLPPTPSRGRSLMPRKRTILTAAVVLVLILLVAAGVFFIPPFLTSSGLAGTSGPGGGTLSPAITPGKVLTSGTIVIRATQATGIPKTGVYVHVNYLGGFKGSYGTKDAAADVPGNSGDRIWEVENATNSTVQATFEKLDGSSHELLVEIYKNGKVLTAGTTTVGHGSVALSVNIATGIAAAPVTSGGGSTAKTTTASSAVKTPASAAKPTTVKTTPVKTTAATANSTTGAS